MFHTMTRREPEQMLEYDKPMGFIGASDLDVAQQFYGDTLGLDLQDVRPFALVHETPAAQLRITAVEEVRAAPYTVYGWVVDDIEQQIDTLSAAGITFLSYDHVDQDARGIWTAPGGSRIAWFRDPDGNLLSLQG